MITNRIPRWLLIGVSILCVLYTISQGILFLVRSYKAQPPVSNAIVATATTTPVNIISNEPAAIHAIRTFDFSSLPLVPNPVCDLNSSYVQSKMNICSGELVAQADENLDKTFADVDSSTYDQGLKIMYGPDLERSQKSWKDYAQSYCIAESDIDSGGSDVPLINNNCLLRLDQNRFLELLSLDPFSTISEAYRAQQMSSSSLRAEILLTGPYLASHIQATDPLKAIVAADVDEFAKRYLSPTTDFSSDQQINSVVESLTNAFGPCFSTATGYCSE